MDLDWQVCSAALTACSDLPPHAPVGKILCVVPGGVRADRATGTTDPQALLQAM